MSPDRSLEFESQQVLERTAAKLQLDAGCHVSMQDPEATVIPVLFTPVSSAVARFQVDQKLGRRDRQLADWFGHEGFVYPDRMVRALRAKHLKPQTAAALLTMETGNGRSVWGHDPVDTFGCYIRGNRVTKDNYRCYKKHRDSGSSHHDMQGCSSTQLTWWAFQNQADRLGGCWHPYYNMLVGFGLIRAYVNQGSTLEQAFTRYNGSPIYGTRAMEWRREWARRLERAGFNVS